MTKRDKCLLLTAAALFLAAGAGETYMDRTEAKAPPEPPQAIVEAIPVTVTLPAVEEYPEPDEDAKITVALVEQGYFREDVPLSYDEQDYLHTACEEFGVDYPVMLALIEHETNFHNIIGDSGRSTGYCQIQLRWSKWLMDEIGAKDLSNPYDNFRTACAILSRYTAKYGNIRDALSAYNTGKPGYTNYADAVLSAAGKWEEVINES